MKKFMIAAALFLALSLCAAAPASGSDAGDPLVSLSYLTGTFSKALKNAAAARLDAAEAAVRDTVLTSGENTTLKEGDVLHAPAGLAITLLEGDVRIDGGTAVDVTQGREVASGLLESGHRYIVAGGTAAAFSVDSPAAVVSWEGYGALVPSARPDCYAIASALRSLGLLRGTDSGVGEGFDLCRTPTRGEGLVMFIRILGEEADALACAYSHPFQDVPAWLNRYVAWAYQKGYANGISGREFGTSLPISAVEYEEFMLRALGYSTAGVDDYAASLERAVDCGALTEGEYAELSTAPFRRAHVVYISYYSLDTIVNGTRRTMAQRLTSRGVLTEKQFAAARKQVESPRLS